VWQGIRLKGEGVYRFSISAPPNLVKEFDSTIRRMGYTRSKAIQTAMGNFISEWKWTHEAEGLMTGGLVAIYDHRVRGLEEGLTDIQHSSQDIIQSTMHIHLDERHCLEIIAVKGEAKTIQHLAEALLKNRGVKQVKLAAIALPT
jgi:CopG family nickel-responsive transcriptional regulator